ncbi:hypothetical protein SADUNF_Sadunf18G0109600 [Salix dunnii]|uniref:Uncharacterized protein n=1 Tax=Salix dunnii TaxID=1413687 RepID=A0A835J4L3_9ROSI|nr:hypothetical protein SADUNF_Sadunf18G0109600 [Salix dunnii]
MISLIRKVAPRCCAGNGPVNVYAKCGCIAKANGIYSKMEHRNLVSWNNMILSGNHGFRRKAMELFRAELVDEGRVSFQFYGINLLYFSSNRGSFLSSCRFHGDIDAGKGLARQLLKLQAATTSPGLWKLLKGNGLKKEPGLSLIEVKETIEKFAVVDFSYSRIGDMIKTSSWTAVEVLPPSIKVASVAAMSAFPSLCMISGLLIDLNRVIAGSTPYADHDKIRKHDRRKVWKLPAPTYLPFSKISNAS